MSNLVAGRVLKMADEALVQETGVQARSESSSATFDALDQIAAGLYTLASMLLGEGQDSAQLVESAIANADIWACNDPEAMRVSGQRALSAAALDKLAQRNPASLAMPEGLEHVASCISDDDLDAAGTSTAELHKMIAGPDRNRVRDWLESLSVTTRTIFVLRGVAGFTAAETAELLVAHGGASALGWSGEAVREIFRQGLCSLASQLLQATTS